MIIEVATIWAFSALFLMMIITAVYFSIFFMIFYIAGKFVALLLRTIGKIMSV